MPDIVLTLRERVESTAARLLARLPGGVKVRLSGEPPITADGLTLDADVQLARAFRRRKRTPALCEPDLATARARYARENLVFRGTPTPVGAVHELTVDGAAGPLPARHYSPAEIGVAPALLVYFHGGGFVIGDLDSHDEACRVICTSAGVQVLSVAYRLAPEHPFPAGLDDAHHAFAWARAHAADFGVAPRDVAVGGDSAGATLATVIAHAGSGTPEAPRAQLLVYPVTDASRSRRSRELFGEGDLFLTGADVDRFSQYYTGGAVDVREDPRVSPLLARASGALAPALVVTAGFDVLRDEGEAYADALREAGTVVYHRREPSLPHGFLHLTGISSEARRATWALGATFRELMDGTDSPGDTRNRS